jgi:hypothetical protein
VHGIRTIVLKGDPEGTGLYTIMLSVPANPRIVASDDRAITPAVQRFMAKRMGARTTEVKASHVPFISQPKEVAKMIEDAAKAAAN